MDHFVRVCDLFKVLFDLCIGLRELLLPTFVINPIFCYFAARWEQVSFFLCNRFVYQNTWIYSVVVILRWFLCFWVHCLKLVCRFTFRQHIKGGEWHIFLVYFIVFSFEPIFLFFAFFAVYIFVIWYQILNR